MIDQPAPPDTVGIWSLDRPGSRRTLFLCATAALIGLAVAGFGLFTAKGTRTLSVPPQSVALVNQVPILLSDYVAQLRSMYDVSLSEATPAQRHKALDQMVRDELYVQRGVELGMQSDTTEVRNALIGAVEAQATEAAIMAPPDESSLRIWYGNHKERYLSEGSMALMDVLLTRVEFAEAAVAALRATGPSPGSMARFGLRPTGQLIGEEFYFDASINLDEKLFAASKRLRDGEVSDPIRTPDGMHILVMKSNHPPTPQPFADVRAAVLADYTAELARQLNARTEKFLKKRSSILIANGFE
jgi:hypothetical protein